MCDIVDGSRLKAFAREDRARRLEDLGAPKFRDDLLFGLALQGYL